MKGTNMQRQTNGQFKFKPFKKSNFSGLKLMIATMAIGYALQTYSEPIILFTPCPNEGCKLVTTVQAKEVAVETIVRTENQQIRDYIKQVFGDQSDNALKILECENAGLNPKAINHNRNGSTDHSIFQVNSIHTKRYGEEFKTNWRANIDVAYKIYQASGWSAWSCSHKIGVMPFYMRGNK